MKNCMFPKALTAAAKTIANRGQSEWQALLATAAALAALAATMMVSEAHSAPAAANSLAIETYMGQVVQHHDGYRAAELSRQAADQYAGEAQLPFSYTLIGSATTTSDSKPQALFRYDRLESNLYSLGIGKTFTNGLQTKLSYSYNEFNYTGISPTQLPTPNYFEASPKIEATLPLWRNFWGRETSGAANALELTSKAKAAGQNATARSILLEAETAYWNLALSREALKVTREAVARAQSMFEWTARRVKLSLSDRAEHLQSTAALKARQLDLRQAQDSERSARLAFNAARGVSNDKVDDELTVLTANLVSKWQTPARTKDRPDTEAARLQASAAEANANAAAERSKPTLELFGQYALNSPLRPVGSDAIADSTLSKYPTSAVGLRLNMPLDFGTTSRAQEGWAAEAAASRALASRKAFEQERDWNEVVARFELAKEKMRLYEDLEEAQKQKFEHERDRQKSGRTTLAQVILFQADYEQTQFARLRALTELLGLNAQMKLYGVAYDSKGSGTDSTN